MIERLLTLPRLPYIVGCAFWAGFVTLGSFFLPYLDTVDYNRALAVFLGKDPATVLSLQIVSEKGLSFVGEFSIFYVVRYMRVKLVAAKPLLSPLLRGEEVFHRLFGRISSTKWPVVITVPFLAIPFSAIISGDLPAPTPTPAPGFFSLIGSSIAFPLIFLAIFTFVWVYFTAIWGLHKLGREIGLKTFYEDKSLGVRPIGALSLSLAVSFFVGIGSFVLASGAAFTPNPGPLGSSVVFILLGAAMFFVPLIGLHKKMLGEKIREQAALRSQFAQLASPSGESHSSSSSDSLARMERILMLEATERKVAAIPTWPFDTGTLNRFAAIVLSIATILVGRYLTWLLLGL